MAKKTETPEEETTQPVEETVEKTEAPEQKAEASEEKKEEKSLEDKKKALLEKAKALKQKVSSDSVSTESLKEEVESTKKKRDPLLPLDDYVKSGIYLGTKVVTPDMRPYVYRRRADGLAIFNTDLIDDMIKEGVVYLSKYDPQDIILVCKRQAGWEAAELFSKHTGIRVFTKKYPAGILTNTALPNFFENKLTIITDAWLDKNALRDTLKVKKDVLMICDTNNYSQGSDKIVIGNNKSPRSIGLIYYLLAKGYCKARGIETDVGDLEDWTGEKDPVQIMKKVKKAASKVQQGV